MRTILAFAFIAALATTASAQRPSSSEREVAPPNAFVKAINNVRVPAEVEGQLTALKADEGENVEKGDVVAVIDDSRAQLTLKLKVAEEKEARLNAENDVNLRDAKNSEETAIAEYKSYAQLESEGATPYWEMEKKRLEAIRATLRIELAELQQEVAQTQHAAKSFERQLAELELERRQITAPFAGFVETRIAQLGEWVQPGSPVVQLVQLDRLRVEGYIDGFSNPGTVRQGAPAKVKVIVADGQVHEADATIGFVSSEMDVNNRYRVWADIENVRDGQNWVIKPGMRASISVQPTEPLAKR